MLGTFVFINMATDDIAAARDFYSKLGFKINETFSSEQNVFIIIAENVQLILARKEFFKQLGEQREFIDTTTLTEASIAISARSREEVDGIYTKAIKAGAKPCGETVEEKEIGLYARAFFDLDGHKIDINYMTV